MSDGGKGCRRRRSQISIKMEALRWELVFKSPTEERKQELLKEIEILKSQEEATPSKQNDITNNQI